jgi:hypothetical protein
MAILSGSQLFNSYVTAADLNYHFFGFNGTNTTYLTVYYPTIYTSNTNMMVQPFIRDVKLEYNKSSLISAGYVFRLGAYCTKEPTLAACTLQVQSYMFEWSSWLVVRFLLILYDSSVISQQQTQYQFSLSQSSTSSTAYFYPAINLS